MRVPHKNIPTYIVQEKRWTKTSFSSQKEMADFVLSNCFKEPGQYRFGESTKMWNEHAQFFTKNGCYTYTPHRTKDWYAFWENEKLKCRLGVLWIDGEQTFYITRDYYFLLNFLQIINKEHGQDESFCSVRDVQYHMMLYEKLADLYHKHASILKRRQMMYEQPSSALVLRHDGWTTMGQIEVGDSLRNPDGTICSVLMKSDNGLKRVYDLVLEDGTSIQCGEKHLWQVFDRKNKKETVLRTCDLVKQGLYSEYPINGKPFRNYRFAINNISHIQYEHQQLPIHPYVLGVLIGDGSISTPQVSFTSYDYDISEKVFKLMGDEYECGFVKTKELQPIDFVIKYKNRFDKKNLPLYKNAQYGCNPLIRELSNLGLLGTKSHTKFIPEKYLYSSVEDRLMLLQGLMDTDGFINKNGRDIHYTTVSKVLANHVWILAKELGITSVIFEGPGFYRVRMSGKIDFDIFSCMRKKARMNFRNSKNKAKPYRRIVEIRDTGKDEHSYCIKVDSPNSLYITDGYTVTHNSFCHMAKCINYLWFENKKTIKLFASDDRFLDEKNGVFKMFNAYKDFLNKHTGWYRPIMGTYPSVQQTIRVKRGGKWEDEGTESTMVAFTLKRDAKLGVGGPCYYAWYEEGGIAPTADTTLQFMAPALENGNEKSGTFCIGGSVGDLDECKPLENMMLDPDAYEMFAVPTTWADDSRKEIMAPLFIPAQYGMPQAVDEWGNSQVEKALILMDEMEAQWKKLPPDQYILRKSQNPRTIKEAFKIRKVSDMPILLMENQQQRIKTKDKEGLWEHKPLKGLLREDRDGNLILHPEHGPEHEYPIIKTWPDKRGCVTIYELPMEQNPKMFTYFSGVDPIEADETSTSDSVASCDIFRKAHKVIYVDKDGKQKVRIEGDKLVATYRGRFDTAEKTNEQMWLLIKMYNAFSLVERNKPNFINYMRRMGRERFLARESDIPLFKDLNVKNAFNTTSPFGFLTPPNKKDSQLWKYFRDTVKDYLKREYSYVYKGNTDEIIKTMRGIDRIDDYWLLEELIVSDDSKNTDRYVSFSAALGLCKIYEINMGISSTYEKTKTADDVPRPSPKPAVVSLLGGYNKPTTRRPNTKVRSLI